jgi:hypothetical protein
MKLKIGVPEVKSEKTYTFSRPDPLSIVTPMGHDSERPHYDNAQKQICVNAPPFAIFYLLAFANPSLDPPPTPKRFNIRNTQHQTP